MDRTLTLSKQQRQIIFCGARDPLIISGFGFGKTFALKWRAILYADGYDIDAEGNMVEHNNLPASIWFVVPDFPLYEGLFDEMAADMGDLGIQGRVERVYHRVKHINGSQIQFKSALDPEKRLRHGHPHLIIMDECSVIKQEAYDKCVARVADKGGRLILSTNVPEGKDWGFDWLHRVYAEYKHEAEQGNQNYAVFQFPTWENRTKYPGGRNDPEILRLAKRMSKAGFARYVGADMSILEGLVYPEYKEQRHLVHNHQPKSCLIAIDPAFGSACAILFCDFSDGNLTVWDEVYGPGLTPSDIVRICKYSDMQPALIVLDPSSPELRAELQRNNWQDRPSPTDVPDLWRLPAVEDKQRENRVHDGIMTVKSWFDHDRIKIDARCEKLRWELSRYSFGPGEKPIKANDHACDALRYLVTSLAAAEREIDWSDPAPDEIYTVERDPDIDAAFLPFGGMM